MYPIDCLYAVNGVFGDRLPRVGTKQYLNAVSPIQYMNVWIPAHWAPVVMEVLETKNEDFRKK